MATNILTLNQPVVQVGLGTQTITIPATLVVPGGTISVANIIFDVYCRSTFTSAPQNGSGGGSGQGLGSGAGGGGTGFGGGGLGLGNGGVGQGFGAAASGYQQPPASGSNQTSSPAQASSLVVTITQNGPTVYTSPAVAPTQDSLQFKTNLVCNAGDVINVVLSSSNPNDLQLNSLKSVLGISQGM